MEDTPETQVTNEKPTKSETAHRTAGLVYCLWLLGILFGVTAVIGAIINYKQLDKARDTHAYSHFILQMTSFWVVLACIIVSLILPGPIGMLFAITAFLVWLFSGLIGSWYLSKSRRLSFLDRRSPEKHSHQRRGVRNTPETNEAQEDLHELEQQPTFAGRS